MKNVFPFDSLYWDFLVRNRPSLKKNPRVAMAFRTWDRMPAQQQEQVLQQAARNLQRIEELAPLSPELLWLGVRVEDAWGNREASARYGLLLKNNFPDAMQTRALQEWEDERLNR